MNDGRTNGELALATGSVQDANQSDFITFDAALLPADRYYMMKAQVRPRGAVTGQAHGWAARLIRVGWGGG